MKLAEALQERSDLNRKIQQLQNRLNNNATVQEGEKPAEEPQSLLSELDASIERLEWIISKVNMTNCSTKVGGRTLTDLISKRDCLTLKIEKYRSFLNSASCLSSRASRTEIKIFSTVNVSDFQKKVDALSKELRLVDNQIQETNWNTELME